MLDFLNSAENVLNVLFVWTRAQKPELGLTEISRLTGINKSTVYKILLSLRERNLVSVEPVGKKYRLDVGILELSGFFMKHLALKDVAHPLLEKLARDSGKTVTMALRKENYLVFIDRVDGSENVRFYCDIGKVVHYNNGAAAKAVFAYLPEEQVKRITEDDEEHRFTEKTKSWRDLIAEIPEIRNKGYSVSDEEVDRGVLAVGAPVFDAAGSAVAGVALATLKATCSEDEFRSIIMLLGECCRNISFKLGYSRLGI